MYRLYSEMIGVTHDSINGREKTEWSNFWYDQANKESQERILLIGDSTVRMIRSTFAREIGCPVDMLGTSSGLHDILFAKQMDIFFTSDCYKYTTIFIQLGHHSRIYDKGNRYEEKDYIRFYEDMCILINYLKQFCERIILLSIFYDVIPDNVIENSKVNILKKTYMWIKRFKNEEFNDDINIIKKEKNSILERIGKECNIPYLDINAFMLNLGLKRKTRFLHVDHIHFEDKAKTVIVEQYKKVLLEDKWKNNE